jgi:hypothetical protein
MMNTHNSMEARITVNRSAKLETPERRKHSRYPFTATVEAVELSSNTRIQGRASDLSRGGCYVDTITSFPVGSFVKMRLTKEMRSFDARAEVVYSLEGMGMGVKFTEADSEQLKTVEKWVGELSGKVMFEQESAPAQSSDGPRAEGKAENVEYEVMKDLITELMRQRVLPGATCESMLQKLNRARRANADSAHV